MGRLASTALLLGWARVGALGLGAAGSMAATPPLALLRTRPALARAATARQCANTARATARLSSSSPSTSSWTAVLTPNPWPGLSMTPCTAWPAAPRPVRRPGREPPALAAPPSAPRTLAARLCAHAGDAPSGDGPGAPAPATAASFSQSAAGPALRGRARSGAPALGSEFWPGAGGLPVSTSSEPVVEVPGDGGAVLARSIARSALLSHGCAPVQAAMPQYLSSASSPVYVQPNAILIEQLRACRHACNGPATHWCFEQDSAPHRDVQQGMVCKGSATLTNSRACGL